MTTENMIVTEQIEAPIAQVYYAISTKSGWIDWFAEKAEGHIYENGIFLTHDVVPGGSKILIFSQLEKNEKAAFRLIESKSLETSEVAVIVEESGSTVKVTVYHEGLDETQAKKYGGFWKKKLANLKSVTETGKDLRLWERPFLGVLVEEWVTEEYAEEKQLAVNYGMLLRNVIGGLGADKSGLKGGDTILSVAGTKLEAYGDLVRIISDYKAGDTLAIIFQRGEEEKETMLTLSSYPVGEIPATAHDLAEKIEKFFGKVGKKIEQMMGGQSDAQLEYRPAAGEWNVKEVLAHMIASKVDIIEALGTMAAGRESYPYTSTVPTRLKTIIALNPTPEALLAKLWAVQAELVMMINELPAEFVSRKSSLARLSTSISMDLKLHYSDHLEQIQETLEKASDVAIS